MRYVVDQMLAGLAKELQSKGIDCMTVQMAIRGDEDSSKAIKDSQILKFLVDSKGSVALITIDNDLADYCETFGVPCVRAQDAILEAIRRSSG